MVLPTKLIRFMFAVSLISLLAGCAPAPEEVRPNIIFILMDDVRWDDIGAYGHPWVRTPHIDRLAREGVRFDRAYAATPLCSPNRASFLTGQYAHTHGITDNVDRSELTHRFNTFPRILQGEGYSTAYIGKWHMGVDDSPRPGFDYWLSIQGQGRYFDPEMNENGERKTIPGYITDILTERSIDFISRERENPFVLYLGHKAVHPNIFQYADSSTEPTPPDGGFGVGAVHERHKDLYVDQEISRAPSAETYAESKPALRREIEGLPPLGPTTGTDDGVIRNRLRLLTAADEGLGNILKVLEERDLLDNTVIIFTSDHGYFYGEHGLDEERRLAYEEISRLPLIVRYPPSIQAGSRIQEFALSIDLAPTLLEMAGVEIPGDMQGRSLVPLLRGEHPQDWRNSFLIEYYSDTVMRRLVTMGYQAVRTDDWKYIRYTDLEGMDELYNLESDPYEIENIINAPEAQARLQDLKAELKRLLEETGGELR
jgi:N-acetylglucosamine-6-sulfatase